MLHYHTHDAGPSPRLDEYVAKQQREGGRLIVYRRAWSAVVFSMTQDRIEHVPLSKSRALAGWKQNLFTLLLGMWSPVGPIVVLMLLTFNLRGGIDVTAQFSNTSIDPMRVLLPDPNQAARDAVMGQWSFVIVGLIIIVVVLCIFGIP